MHINPKHTIEITVPGCEAWPEAERPVLTYTVLTGFDHCDLIERHDRSIGRAPEAGDLSMREQIAAGFEAAAVGLIDGRNLVEVTTGEPITIDRESPLRVKAEALMRCLTVMQSAALIIRRFETGRLDAEGKFGLSSASSSPPASSSGAEEVALLA